MIVGLLWIFGSYGLAVALVHVCHSFFHWNRKRPIYYVLITKNNGLQMEWYLRSLLFFSWFKGRKVRVIVMDEGSTDETTQIAGKMAEQRPEEIETIRLDHPDVLDQWIARFEREEVVMVRLSNQEEMQKIPLFQ